MGLTTINDGRGSDNRNDNSLNKEGNWLEQGSKLTGTRKQIG